MYDKEEKNNYSGFTFVGAGYGIFFEQVFMESMEWKCLWYYYGVAVTGREVV